MTGFDRQFIGSQKEKLLAEKKHLESKLNARADAPDQDSDDYQTKHQEFGDDVESNANEYAENETAVNVVASLEEELHRVDSALARLAAGKYGLDVNTGQPISRERLEAYPAAETNV